MSKYVINFEDNPWYQDECVGYYKCGEIPWWSAKKTDIKKLTPLDKELEEAYQKGYDAAWVNVGECEDRVAKQAYQKGFEAGQHEATTLEYQQGLDDAWECMKAIAFLNKPRDMRDFFGCSTLGDVLIDYTASEAIEKLKAYEERQKADEIKVGDEVCFVFAGGETIEPFIVFSIKDDNGKKYYEGIQTSDGRWVSGGLKYYKTGRHFQQVAELFKAMKEGAE